MLKITEKGTVVGVPIARRLQVVVVVAVAVAVGVFFLPTLGLSSEAAVAAAAVIPCPAFLTLRKPTARALVYTQRWRQGALLPVPGRQGLRARIHTLALRLFHLVEQGRPGKFMKKMIELSSLAKVAGSR